MSTPRNYDKVDDNNTEEWKPAKLENEQPVPIDPNNPPFIEGYLSEIKHGIGKHNSEVYVIHTVDEKGNLLKLVSAWGSSVLDDKMKDININSFVKIQFNGRVYRKGVEPVQPNGAKTFMTSTNSFNSWDVFVWKDAPSYASLVGKIEETPVAQKEPAPYNGPATNTATPKVENAESVRNQLDSEDLPF